MNLQALKEEYFQNGIYEYMTFDEFMGSYVNTDDTNEEYVDALADALEHYGGYE